mgnify:FL=1
MKKSILLLLMLFVMASNLAFAKTVDEATFTNEAKLAQLKVKKYEQTDIMGNEIKGVCVRHAPSKLLGFSGVKIFCNNNLDTSNMIISIGVSFIQNKNNESEIPVPKTIVINNKGNRVDIPAPNYKYDSGRSTLFGAWSEYNINVPLNLLADSGIEHIDGLSIIMVNPTTGTEGSYEAILTQKEKKDIAKINDIYSFFLKLNK